MRKTTFYVVLLNDNSEFVMEVFDTKNATERANYLAKRDFSWTQIKDIRKVRAYTY